MCYELLIFIFVLKSKRDDQMLKRRNISGTDSVSPLKENNAQQQVWKHCGVGEFSLIPSSRNGKHQILCSNNMEHLFIIMSFRLVMLL